jgi:hypothetical protein
MPIPHAAHHDPSRYFHNEGVFRWPGGSGNITPSMANWPSRDIRVASFGRFDGRSLRILLRGVPAYPSLARRSRRRSDIESERVNPVAHPISSKRHPTSPTARLVRVLPKCRTKDFRPRLQQ